MSIIKNKTAAKNKKVNAKAPRVIVQSQPAPAPVRKPKTFKPEPRRSRFAPEEEPKTPVVPVAEDLLPDEEHPAIQQLLELGKQKNFVTYDDILHFFPEAERDIDQLDEVHAALLAAGIEVVDTVDADEPSEDDMEETEAEIETETMSELGEDETYLSAIDADD